MAIGDKYYRKYLSLSRCGVNQRDVAIVSQSSSDDGCSASSNTKASFESWKSLLHDRKQFVEDVGKATQKITEEVISALKEVKPDELKCEEKQSSIDGIKEKIAQLLQGQLETKQQVVQLLKHVVQQKEVTDMIVDKLSSARTCKTTTNSVDMTGKHPSELAHTEMSMVSPSIYTTASAPGFTEKSMSLTSSDVKSIGVKTSVCKAQPYTSVCDHDEIKSATSCKRMKLSSMSQCDHPQQEKEHVGRVNKLTSEAGIHLEFQSGKKLSLATPVKDLDTEKQVQQRQGIYCHVTPREGKLPSCCTSASPMNALDDTLYSQASPATGSTLTQSKPETGLQVSFDKFNRSSEAARRKEKIFADFSGSNSVFEEISMTLKHQTVTSIEESP